MSENALEHWSTERMILEGHADYATAEDLEGLDDSLLLDISKICEMDVMSPDECIPCLALAMHLDRQRERLENLAPKDEHLDPNLGDAGEIDFKPETPKLDALMDEAPVFTEPEVKDTASQFADKVAELQDLVKELLHGPPIPPPNVTVADLALLVVAADRWTKMTEGQGLELSPNQQAVLDSTKALVSRLRS